MGLDLSPVQPAEVPENCEFIVGDLTETLEDFDNDTFDLVHSR
jgi:predicted O-methyltransferase YrrM